MFFIYLFILHILLISFLTVYILITESNVCKPVILGTTVIAALFMPDINFMMFGNIIIGMYVFILSVFILTFYRMHYDNRVPQLFISDHTLHGIILFGVSIMQLFLAITTYIK